MLGGGELEMEALLVEEATTFNAGNVSMMEGKTVVNDSGR